MLFFSCFFFFCLNLLTGTIKTESVLVKTDEIVVRGSQLLNPKKNLAINHHDENVLRRLPENSLLKKVLEKKHFVIGLRMKSEIIEQMAEEGINSFYFLARDLILLRVLSLLAPYGNFTGMVAFRAPKKYHEWLTVFYFRSNLDEQRKRFLRRRYEMTSI